MKIFEMAAAVLLVSSLSVACGDDFPDYSEIISGSNKIDKEDPEKFGECTLSSIFSDGAVLQRNSRIPIFGRTEAGAAVKVSNTWNGKTVTVHADASGRFEAMVETPDAGGPYSMTVNDITINDIMIGEVWLCSGQSNMRFRLNQSDMDGLSQDEELDVHVFVVPDGSSTVPEDDFSKAGTWYYGAVSEIQSRVTAVGYYFARKLNMESGIPVGIISAAVGSSTAEEWMDSEAFETLSDEYKEMYEPSKEAYSAGCLYNSMIHPLYGYGIGGILWYQGEANVYWPDSYYSVLTSLAESWREGFGDESLPFYIVQLPSYGNSKWASFRPIQQKVADNLEYSGFVPTIDTGEEKNIHPVFKRSVGERLAELALSNVCGFAEFRSQSPAFENAAVGNGNIRISFKNVGSGLVSHSGAAPDYFEICGDDDVYYSAEAEIDGNTVILSSDNVPEPVKARYYMVSFGTPDLFTSDGWPIPPFEM